MSDKTDQLIAKALSTTSEDEAIACLRMARKHNDGKTYVKATASSSSDNTDWEATARRYHKLAYKMQEDLKSANLLVQLYKDMLVLKSRELSRAKTEASNAVGGAVGAVVVFGLLALSICMAVSVAYARH